MGAGSDPERSHAAEAAFSSRQVAWRGGWMTAQAVAGGRKRFVRGRQRAGRRFAGGPWVCAATPIGARLGECGWGVEEVEVRLVVWVGMRRRVYGYGGGQASSVTRGRPGGQVPPLSMHAQSPACCTSITYEICYVAMPDTFVCDDCRVAELRRHNDLITLI